ncbi:MAG: hypothetical protein ACKVS8_11090 [Phycisphaerales bacterium]
MNASGKPAPTGSPLDRHMMRSGAGAGSKRSEVPESGLEARPEQPVLMLDFVMKNGDRVGLPYAYLSGAALDGNEHLVLTYSDRTVELRGRNLLALYNHVLAHTARRIETAGSPFDDGVQAVWVESITVRDRE